MKPDTGIIIEELKRIAKKHDGILNPKDVVESASAKDHPLHKCFQWDNKIAGEQYRLWQARELITIQVKYDKSISSDPIQYYVSLTTDRSAEGGYRDLVGVLSDKYLRAQLLMDALNEMHRFQAKYRELTELADIFSAMESVDKKVKKNMGTDSSSSPINA